MALTDNLASRPRQTSTPTEVSTADTVMITRADNGQQVFAAARPMKANVYEVAELMEHPLEDGSAVTDHIVYRAVEIEQPLIITGSDELASVFDEIRQLYLSGEVLNVQTRARLYESMVIQAIPHDEQPDSFDSVTVGLQLKEARFVKTQYAGAIGPARVAPPAAATPANPRPQARVSTVRRGTQQTQPPAPAQQERGSILYRRFVRRP